MERKLQEEKRKLDAMVRDAGGINAKINVDGTVYHVRTEDRRWDCTVHVERLGTVEEFLLLVSKPGEFGDF